MNAADKTHSINRIIAIGEIQKELQRVGSQIIDHKKELQRLEDKFKMLEREYSKACYEHNKKIQTAMF